MILDMLPIAVGWVLVTTTSALHLRRFPLQTFGPFAPRRTSVRGPRLDWRLSAVFVVGIVVPVWGGADAQHHYIGWWALALVFLPMLVAVALITTVHNRQVKDRPAQ